MAKKKDLRTKAEDSKENASAQDEAIDEALSEGRNRELTEGEGGSDVLEACLDLYEDIEKGFDDQRERADQQMDDWDIFNCHLGNRQFYNGNSQIFVPIVHDAVNARVTRFTNQIFPQSGRNVDCVSSDGTLPHALISLLEFYIRKAKLRTQVIPAMIRNGDVEGQYNFYVSWRKTKRHVVQRVKRPAQVSINPDDPNDMEGAIDDPETQIDDIVEQTVVHGSPHVEVLADSAILVLPQTSDSFEEALSDGGSVSILRRWKKATIRKMIKDGEIRKDAGEKLLDELMTDTDSRSKPDKEKEMVDAAGIRKDGRGKYALVYETWTELTIDDERRKVRIYFASKDNVLSCKLNPMWSDHLPLISSPVQKLEGAFKGQSMLKPVRDLQYFANDTINEAADSAAYALMPIIMTDPNKNPRVGSMILSMAAIWETSPQDTQFAKFPELWQQGLTMIASIKSEIFQALSVNPAMVTPSNTQKKQNQAEVAQAQQIDLLSTADAVTIIEDGQLTPLLQRMIELDHQYRDEAVTVPMFGELGRRIQMEEIPPITFDRHYQFKWLGVEAAREAQRMQQQIAGMNVIRGIPPEQLGGHKVNLVPLITQLVENMFGPRLAPLVFVSPEAQLPVPVNEENLLLDEGYAAPVHEMDDDDQHIQAHMMAMKISQGSSQKKFQVHIFQHMQQKAKKQQAAMAAQKGGMPGVPGGAGPGVAGTPRPGAQPGQPRGGQNPPGAIHPDNMPLSMPRNM